MPLFVGVGTSAAAPAPASCPVEPTYYNTIPTPVGPPSTMSLGEDDFATTAYAALGNDKKLYYVESFIDNEPPSVSPLACLGGTATDAPAIAEGLDGTRAFFVRTKNNSIYQRYVTGGDFDPAGPWSRISNAAAASGPAALVTPDGQYHLFYRGTDGALYHGYRQSEALQSWRWEKLGGQITGTPNAVVDGSRILVAAAGIHGPLFTITGRQGSWGPFVQVTNSVNGSTGVRVTSNVGPSLVRDPATGGITMYAVSRSTGLYAIAKNSGAGWSGALWYQLDDLLPQDARIAAATDGENTIVYATFLDRAANRYVTAYTQYLDAAGEWSDYYLAPYTCSNCAPYDADLAAPSKRGKTLASAKLSPGGGTARRMPATPKVLG